MSLSDYPYILKPRSLESFLTNMPDRPKPPKVTQSYLSSVGYTSSTERAIIPVLKFIKFIAANGSPTDSFKLFRDTTKSKAIMAQVLKENYKNLFDVHSNPCQASDPDLENFFRTATGRGGRMLKATVDAFQVLCKFADFGAPPPTPTPTPTPAKTVPTTVTPTPTIQLPVTKEAGVTLNVNIRLELPATQDAEVYDKIFQSLKKHLLTPSSKAD